MTDTQAEKQTEQQVESKYDPSKHYKLDRRFSARLGIVSSEAIISDHLKRFSIALVFNERVKDQLIRERFEICFTIAAKEDYYGFNPIDYAQTYPQVAALMRAGWQVQALNLYEGDGQNE